MQSQRGHETTNTPSTTNTTINNTVSLLALYHGAGVGAHVVSDSGTVSCSISSILYIALSWRRWLSLAVHVNSRELSWVCRLGIQISRPTDTRTVFVQYSYSTTLLIHY